MSVLTRPTWWLAMLGGLLGKKANPDTYSRGLLGVEITDNEGAVSIKSVLEDGPAAKAGLKAGDRIVKVNNRNVYGADGLADIVGKLPSNKSVKVIVKRDDKEVEVTLKTGEGL